MGIETRCPSCKKILKAKDSMAGKKVKCPGCGMVLKLPGGKPVEEFDDVEIIEEEEDDLFGGYSAKEAVGSLVDSPKLKPCRECGEMIPADAKFCPECGEAFGKRRTSSPQRKRSLSDVPSRSSAADEMTGGDWIICICCPGIGCIVGVVRLCQGRSSGAIMIGVSLLFAILGFFIGFSAPRNVPR